VALLIDAEAYSAGQAHAQEAQAHTKKAAGVQDLVEDVRNAQPGVAGCGSAASDRPAGGKAGALEALPLVPLFVAVVVVYEKPSQPRTARPRRPKAGQIAVAVVLLILAGRSRARCRPGAGTELFRRLTGHRRHGGLPDPPRDGRLALLVALDVAGVEGARCWSGAFTAVILGRRPSRRWATDRDGAAQRATFRVGSGCLQGGPLAGQIEEW
jgi:hypothetical protein